MYNEQEGAERCVHEVQTALQALGARSRLVVVNDGSRDATGEVLNRLAQRHRDLDVLTHSRNRGYGAALRTGVDHAATERFEYVLFMDSDLTNDPKYLPLFMERMADGYDVIKASRYVKGGGMKGVPRYRRIVSSVSNRIASLLFGLGVRDCTNGFRAIKTDLLARMRLRENGFALILEELYQAKLLGARCCEVPYFLTARDSEVRGSSFSYRPKVFYDYLKYAVKSFLERTPPDSGP